VNPAALLHLGDLLFVPLVEGPQLALPTKSLRVLTVVLSFVRCEVNPYRVKLAMLGQQMLAAEL